MFKKSANGDKKVDEAEPSSPTFGSKATQKEYVNRAGLVGQSQHQYLKLADQMPESKNDTLISPEELAAHIELDDAWLSLDGIVYDVTPYMRYHPGGKKLLEGCGIECRQLFNKYHSWVNGQYLLKKFKVGNLSHSAITKPKYGASLK